MRVKPNILVTSEVLSSTKSKPCVEAIEIVVVCFFRACLEFVLVLSDLRQMEAKSLHYSGLLTTLQLRLAEGC